MTKSEDLFPSLVDAAKRGDRAAVAKLVEMYEPKVRIVARVLLGRLLRPYLDSVDLVQSVHRSLMVGFRQQKYYFENSEQLIALATTMVRRKVSRHWRRLQRQQRLSAGHVEFSNLPTILTSLSDCRENPAEAAQFNDQVEHLCRHLDQAERRMLEMRLQGYTAAEVGSELGMHPVAVRVRWMRMRRQLQANGVVTDWL